MSAQMLLSRLERVRSSGRGSWKASCPGPLHKRGDRSPSLHITENSDAVLLHCFAGCKVPEIVAAVGLELSDLSPDQLTHRRKGAPHRVMKSEVFDLAIHEVGVVWLIGCDMHKNKAIPEDDYRRLCEAMAKLERIADAAYGS